jgi:putative ABC transport system permease protein
MNLVRLISWPYVRKHLLRCLLTIVGIVLGVALLVAMRTANESVLRSFNRTVDGIAGKAQLQVSSGEAGFPEEVLERVQAVPDVAVAAPVIEASVDTRIRGEGKLLILGIDFLGDRSLRQYDFESGDRDIIEDPLVFLAQPDSLIATREFADRNGVRVGDKVVLDTAQGPRPFTVRGVLKAGGMAAAFGGDLAIMDIYAAQQVFGGGRRFTRIDIALQAGVSLEGGEAALRKALGEGFTVEPPSGRGQQFESLLSVFSLSVNIFSVFALLIGMFIIYNSFAVAVTQRRSEIGILRALGATRAQIRGLFLMESACAGLIGSIAGLAAGLAFAAGLTGIFGRLLEAILGVAQNAREISFDWPFLSLVLLLGVFTSMVAAWIPANDAASVEPVRALQKGSYQAIGAGESRVRQIAAAAAASGALACLALARYRLLFYAGYLAVIFAALLLTPFLSLALSKLLRYPLRWIRPAEGSLAADSLILAPRRTSATVTALMLSLALAIGTAGVARANYEYIEKWASEVLNPDLFVTPSESIVRHDLHFPASLRQELEQIPGIDEADPVRSPRIQFRGQPVTLLAAEFGRIEKRVHQNLVAGDPATVYKLVEEQKGVLVSENLANLQHISPGQIVELNTPAGLLRLPAVGIMRDYSNQLGVIFIERGAYLKAYQDDTVDLFRIYVKPGASIAEVRRQINTRVGRNRRLFVWLNKDVRDFVIDLANQWFGITYLQVFVAVGVAVLGIVNSMIVSISDRRREFGVLRAVGGLRAQIRVTVWLEAVALGVIGLVLGNTMGAINLYYELQAIGNSMIGVSLTYSFPVGIAALLLPLILGAAWAAAILPAESAVRAPLVEALEYE